MFAAVLWMLMFTSDASCSLSCKDGRTKVSDGLTVSTANQHGVSFFGLHWSFTLTTLSVAHLKTCVLNNFIFSICVTHRFYSYLGGLLGKTAQIQTVSRHTEPVQHDVHLSASSTSTFAPLAFPHQPRKSSTSLPWYNQLVDNAMKKVFRCLL